MLLAVPDVLSAGAGGGGPARPRRGGLGRRPRHRRPPVGPGQGQPAARRGLGGGPAARRDDRAARCSATPSSSPPRCPCGSSRPSSTATRAGSPSAPTWTTRCVRCRARHIACAPTSRPRSSSRPPTSTRAGELVVEDTFGVHSVKLAAGHLILYPSTSLHHVRPVTRGARLASFFWIQSMVRDDAERTLLFDLDCAIQRLGPRPPRTPLRRAAHRRLPQPAAALGGALTGLPGTLVMTFRKALVLDCTSPPASLAGVVILIMSVTGTLLMYERQMTAWADGYSLTPPPGAGGFPSRPWPAACARGPHGGRLEHHRSPRPHGPRGLRPRARGHALRGPLLGRDPGRGFEAGPRLLPRGDRLAPVPRHRTARAAPPAARSRARRTSLFLFIVLSGHLPLVAEELDVRVRAARWSLFQGGLRGKARDFNWHNVIGIWSAVPLAFVVASASRHLVPLGRRSRLSGDGQRTTAARRPGGDGKRAGPSPPRASPGRPSGRGGPPRSTLSGLDRLWARAEQEVSGLAEHQPAPAERARLALVVQRRHVLGGAASRPSRPGHLRPEHRRARSASRPTRTRAPGGERWAGSGSSTPAKPSASRARRWRASSPRAAPSSSTPAWPWPCAALCRAWRRRRAASPRPRLARPALGHWPG